MINLPPPATFTALLLSLPVVALATTEATIKVTTTVDSVAGDGQCSLREAIEAANRGEDFDACEIEGTGPTLVLLGEGVHVLTIEGPASEHNASGDLIVINPITLRGAGARLTTIDAGGLSRALYFKTSAVVEDLRVTGGNAGNEGGGGIYADGLELLLSNVILEGNTASKGGGLYAALTETTIRHSLIQGNSAAVSGGGVELRLATQNRKSRIESSTIANNTAPLGGGLMNKSKVVLEQVTFSGNSASQYGSAIYNDATMSLDAVAVICTGEGHESVINSPTSPVMPVNNSVFVGHARPLDGEFESEGVNYIEAAVRPNFASARDIVVIPGNEPPTVLRDLGHAGGFTPVHPPKAGGPLIGASACQNRSGVAYGLDQRGAPRPATGCTIGPVEYGALGIATRVELASADACPYGGIVGYTGEDNGYGQGIAGDRLLSAGETEASDTQCNTPDTLVELTNEAPGDNCQAGGQRIDTGLDLDRNGTLETDEITRTRFVCQPPPVLYALVDFDSSDDCPFGGHRLVSGADVNGNGLLEEEEITSATESCRARAAADGEDGENGKDGADGKDGLDGLDGKDGKDGKDGLNGQDAEGGCAAAGVSSLAFLALACSRRRRGR